MFFVTMWHGHNLSQQAFEQMGKAARVTFCTKPHSPLAVPDVTPQPYLPPPPAPLAWRLTEAPPLPATVLLTHCPEKLWWELLWELLIYLENQRHQLFCMSVLAFWAPNLRKPACFHVGIHELVFSAGISWHFLTLVVFLQQFLLFFFLSLDEVEVEACEGHVWLRGRSSWWAHLQWGWRSGGTRRGRCWLVGEYKKKRTTDLKSVWKRMWETRN